MYRCGQFSANVLRFEQAFTDVFPDAPSDAFASTGGSEGGTGRGDGGGGTSGGGSSGGGSSDGGLARSSDGGRLRFVVVADLSEVANAEHLRHLLRDICGRMRARRATAASAAAVTATSAAAGTVAGTAAGTATASSAASAAVACLPSAAAVDAYVNGLVEGSRSGGSGAELLRRNAGASGDPALEPSHSDMATVKRLGANEAGNLGRLRGRPLPWETSL